MTNATSPYFTTVDSPIGELLLAGDGDALHLLYMNDANDYSHAIDGRTRNHEAFKPVIAQLQSYFAGDLLTFDLNLQPIGTPFQRAVWDALYEIPYGETRSYGQIAAQIGKPKAARAVGMANNKNPIAVIVPCHRVVGSKGALTGYAGGLGRKEWLLTHERQALLN